MGKMVNREEVENSSILFDMEKEHSVKTRAPLRITIL